MPLQLKLPHKLALPGPNYNSIEDELDAYEQDLLDQFPEYRNQIGFNKDFIYPKQNKKQDGKRFIIRRMQVLVKSISDKYKVDVQSIKKIVFDNTLRYPYEMKGVPFTKVNNFTICQKVINTLRKYIESKIHFDRHAMFSNKIRCDKRYYDADIKDYSETMTLALWELKKNKSYYHESYLEAHYSKNGKACPVSDAFNDSPLDATHVSIIFLY